MSAQPLAAPSVVIWRHVIVSHNGHNACRVHEWVDPHILATPDQGELRLLTGRPQSARQS